MVSDHKLAWAIVISLGCHALILFLATEYAPWKVLKAGEKSSIVVQLNDLSGKQSTSRKPADNWKEKVERRVARPEQKTAAKPATPEEQEIERRPPPETTTVPDQENGSDTILMRDRAIGSLLTEPQDMASGSWHAEYAGKLREMIKENQRYPIMAVRNRLQGTVMVGFILNRTGELIECHITEPCRHEILDRAALRAVKSVRKFPPFPESVSWEQAGFVVPVTFQLEQ